jgi:hypothetical protein
MANTTGLPDEISSSSDLNLQPGVGTTTLERPWRGSGRETVGCVRWQAAGRRLTGVLPWVPMLVFEGERQ